MDKLPVSMKLDWSLRGPQGKNDEYTEKEESISTKKTEAINCLVYLACNNLQHWVKYCPVFNNKALYLR